jgi:hydroxymethylpyrimidine pyrophosphatase-like HAD family hydrolase
MDAARTRCLYLDLDGTLLGRGGSLLHDGEGGVSLEGARAVQTCLRAGVEVVLCSGRRRVRVAENARLLGQHSYIFEGGACVVLDGEEHWLARAPGAAAGEDPGGAPREDGITIAQQMERAGATTLLLSRYRGRLEFHEPWSREREASHLFRGLLDTAEANRLLAEHGHGDLRLFDNGVLRRRPPSLSSLVSVHAYHLVTAGVSKAAAVAMHARARGYVAAETLAVGDSRMDLECAPYVREFWLVANALESDPGLADAIRAHENAFVTEAAYGAGVYEAVVRALMA